MSCFGITRDKIQQWFQRLKTYFQNDHVQVEIVRQILKQVLVSVDQVYGAEPVPMEKIKEQLDKYIDLKVDEKITELLEFCRMAGEAEQETSAKASVGPSVSVQSTDGSASVQSTDESPSFQDCYGDMEEIPLGDVNVEVPDDVNVETEALKAKKKSLLKRLFKKRLRRSGGEAVTTEKKKPLLFRKLIKRLPVV